MASVGFNNDNSSATNLQILMHCMSNGPKFLESLRFITVTVLKLLTKLQGIPMKNGITKVLFLCHMTP